MKILLHICCAPCSIYPLQKLREEKADVMGYFYRLNIHPFSECMKRQSTLTDFAASAGLGMIYQKGYDIESFFQRTAFREGNRCRICYHDRLKSTGMVAKKGKFDCFTTTLLYSKFQNHEQIRSIGESIGKTIGVPFYYQDFRIGWKVGIEESKRLNMYRQHYCGCIYSEKERFYRETHQI